MSEYAEIAVTTNFSFLRGASHARELVLTAALHGHAAIGIADRNTLAGVVRAYEAITEVKTGAAPRLLVGARLVFVDGTPDILAYPTDRDAYGRLCRLLSTGKLRAAKGECILSFSDLVAWQEGLLLVVMPPHPARDDSAGDPFKKAWNNLRSHTPSVSLRFATLATSPMLRTGEENQYAAGDENKKCKLTFPPPSRSDGGGGEQSRI